MSIDEFAVGLPIREALADIRAHLSERPNLVLVAPPGAGKTTCVALALLQEEWLAEKRIMLMLPRRLAARSAAERIAQLLGEEVGQRVGYRTRLESKVGRDARIECVTEGLFVNRLLSDPELENIGALLFDEVHERNLDGDLGLALALDLQQLRPDLRIMAMSATLDGARFSGLMEEAPVLEVEGQSHPIEIRYAGRAQGRVEEQVASVISRAMASEEGSLLAFLPGVGEIKRTAEYLSLPPDIELYLLHGNVDPAAQRAAIRKSAKRKCVLSTAIAETSLTINGVRLVVDAGLSRRPRFDQTSGLMRLVTERVSQAAATQRGGRAGRQAPGIVWRLWEAEETRGLIPFDPPEILETDLVPLILRLAVWGVSDPSTLKWLDPPPMTAVMAARVQLEQLGAVDADGRLTEHGRAIAGLPLHPRLAHMLIEGAASGDAHLAATIALVLEERGLGGRSADLEERVERVERERGGRVVAARKLRDRWAGRAKRLQPAREDASQSTGMLLAHAFPDRIARRRREPGPSDEMAEYLLANGRGARLGTSEPLARHEWLLVADAGGSSANAHIRLAAELSAADISAISKRYGTVEERLTTDPASGRHVAERRLLLGAIEVERERLAAEPAQIQEALLAEVLAMGVRNLAWPEKEQTLLQRVDFARAHGLADLPDCSDTGLAEQAELWLLPRLQGINRLADVDLAGALAPLFSYRQMQNLYASVPERFQTPAGTSHPIDYTAEGGPMVEVRVQAVFGLAEHPNVANIPLNLALTSPAGRPLALTRDLPAFWKVGWKDVQREMKGRYPRHPWPDDPANATPTVRSKNADARRR